MLALWINFGIVVNGKPVLAAGALLVGGFFRCLGRADSLLLGPPAGGVDISSTGDDPSGMDGDGLGCRRAPAVFSG